MDIAMDAAMDNDDNTCFYEGYFDQGRAWNDLPLSFYS
jgi:hypothetical protein